MSKKKYFYKLFFKFKNKSQGNLGSKNMVIGNLDMENMPMGNLERKILLWAI